MNEIYQQYANSVYRFLLSKTRNEDIAEELTQETFYQAIRSINKFDGSCKLSTWLFGIAKNQYFNYSRKNPILQDVSEYEEKLESNEKVDEKIISSFERVDMIRALHECKEPYREVLYQRIFGNLSFREIGDVLGKSENWARVTYYRGKEQLKKEIDFLKKNRKHLETILRVTIGLAISVAIAVLIFALCKYAITKRKEAIPTNDNEIVLYQDRSDYEPADMKNLEGYYYQTSENNFISDGEFKIDGSYYFCLTTREAPYIYSDHSLTRDIGNDTFEIMTYLYNRYNQQDELLKFTVQSIGNHQIAVYILESETAYFEEGEIIIFTESEYYDVE